MAEDKEIVKERNKKYRNANKETMKAYYQNNKEALKEKRKEYQIKNKEKISKRTKEYTEKNKDKVLEWAKKAKIREKVKRVKLKKELKYFRETDVNYLNEKAHKKEVSRLKRKKYLNDYHKNRRETDLLFRMSKNLRTRTYIAFKRSSWNKISKTKTMLGCEYETAFNNIDNKFTKGMTWENMGEWEIDHIIPLSSAKTKEELIKLCHYTNLQPLWKIDNRKKGCKI